jgi:SAM-dependent methyltransferase
VPQLNLKYRFATTGGPGVSFSTGDMSTAHADFMNGWDEERLRVFAHNLGANGVKMIPGGTTGVLQAYYRNYVDRYRRTLDYVIRLPLPQPAEIFEIGGGQIALLARELFGDGAAVGDVNRKFAESVLRHGLEFIKCDLLHDTMQGDRQFDLIVLCEVVEHLPVPLCTVLQRILPALKPDGYILITTPNLYRLRNVVRLALGRDIFCPFFYPDEAT